MKNKHIITDERLQGLENTILAHIATILMAGLLVSIFIKSSILHLGFQSFLTEAILLAIVSLYWIIQSWRLALGLATFPSKKESIQEAVFFTIILRLYSFFFEKEKPVTLEFWVKTLFLLILIYLLTSLVAFLRRKRLDKLNHEIEN